MPLINPESPAGEMPLKDTVPLFTAARIAAVLALTRQAVGKRLGGGLAPLVTDSGQTANAWPWEALPKEWREQIKAASDRKGYRFPQDLLADAGAAPWQPGIRFAAAAPRFQEEAEQWRKALLPVLTRQHDADPNELRDAGLAECRRVFGREVSESTWRRRFDLAVERDRGFERWARIEIYLPEEAMARAQASGAPPTGSAPADLAALTDAAREIATPSKLAPRDRDFVFEALQKCDLDRAAALDYAFSAFPGLARTRKALTKWYRRKLVKVRAAGDGLSAAEDGRGRSGRKGSRLCPECERNVKGAAVDLDGDLAQAWRRMTLEKKLCAKCAGLWHFAARTNKSYVPLAVRKQVGPDVLCALPWRHGPHRARLLSPYVLRNPDIAPGDVFEADDVTWNHYFYVWNTDESGKPYVGRGECLLFLDRRSWYPVGYRLIAGGIDAEGKQAAAHYTGVDIRLGVLRVHDKVGLPRKGFQFENGIWRSRLVAGKKARGWEFNQWREVERGLNEEGIILGAGEKAVRHALPGNPRTKIIERVIRAVQERMRPLPGFAGFNHREYKPELLNAFLARVNGGKEHPGNMFMSLAQFRDALDVELMAYAHEIQNGRWLPGVSPLEAWENGIGKYPGVKDKPLRQLGNARYLLSTHWRKAPVTGQGIRFEAPGGRPLVFWDDALLPWRNRIIPVRWNIEEPELLHCVPPGAAPFTLQQREMPSWTATAAELAETGAARNRWTRSSKALSDNLPHPLVSYLVRDSDHSAGVHALGETIGKATEERRAEKEADTREEKRLAALAGALGMEVSRGSELTQEQIEARQRRLARIQAVASEENQ